MGNISLSWSYSEKIEALQKIDEDIDRIPLPEKLKVGRKKGIARTLATARYKATKAGSFPRPVVFCTILSSCIVTFLILYICSHLFTELKEIWLLALRESITVQVLVLSSAITVFTALFGFITWSLKNLSTLVTRFEVEASWLGFSKTNRKSLKIRLKREKRRKNLSLLKRRIFGKHTDENMDHWDGLLRARKDVKTQYRKDLAEFDEQYIAARAKLRTHLDKEILSIE